MMDKIWGSPDKFEPFCLDLGHIAWILAIWQNLGQNRPQRRQNPEDRAGGTYIRTDGWTDSPCVLQDFIPFGAAAQKPRFFWDKVEINSE